MAFLRSEVACDYCGMVDEIAPLTGKPVGWVDTPSGHLCSLYCLTNLKALRRRADKARADFLRDELAKVRGTAEGGAP